MATTPGCEDIPRKPLHIISKQTVGPSHKEGLLRLLSLFSVSENSASLSDPPPG